MGLIMPIARRTFLAQVLSSTALIGCSLGAQDHSHKTKVYVMGVIHSRHLESQDYSLQVLDAAIRKAAPDIVLTEIPPARVDQAVTSFRETGMVDEPRTRVFPEYTQSLFPLSREMGFEIVGTAGWTPEIAQARAAALEAIQNDPERAQEWAKHRAARRAFSQALSGRGDDPRFIHTDEYDALVEAAYAPYERYFDDDLGAGGWQQINAAHTELMHASLDKISGRALRVLITFGASHKYKIRQSLAQRQDVELLDSAKLFV